MSSFKSTQINHYFIVNILDVDGLVIPHTFEKHQSIEAVAFAKKNDSEVLVFEEVVTKKLVDTLYPSKDTEDVIYVDSLEATLPTVDGKLFDMVTLSEEES